MDLLKHTIQSTTLSTKNNLSKFAKPPTSQATQLIHISYKQKPETNPPKPTATQKQSQNPMMNKKCSTNDNNSNKSTLILKLQWPAHRHQQ